MKIAASFLDIKEPKCEELAKLDSLDVDYIHLDVMDGIFVENKTYTYEEFYNITRLTTKPKDIHLMVSDVKKYIDEFSKMNPEFITFHYEAASEVSSVINYIKDTNIRKDLRKLIKIGLNKFTSFLKASAVTGAFSFTVSYIAEGRGFSSIFTVPCRRILSVLAR